MFSGSLPAALMLADLRSAAPAREPQECLDPSSDMQGRLIEALLGDAALTACELPDGWREAETSEEPLLAGHELDVLVLGSLRRAFEFTPTGERIEHEVAVLPRWAAREFDGASPRDRPLDYATPAASSASFGVACDVRALDVMRYGTIVSALAHEAPGLDPAIAAAAADKCRRIAEVLR
jgi:hypothetical protein